MSTPVEQASDTSVLIGSNLHIHCGAAEIAKVDAAVGRIAVELTDAGAREGDLFFWSGKPLKVDSAAGMKVGTVESAGDHIWKLSVTARQSGEFQMLRLKVD